MNLRPQALDDFIGQSQVIANLKVFLSSALAREKALDHVMFFGPPGVGKTTLAKLVGNFLKVNVKFVSGPALQRGGDLASLLTKNPAKGVIFIDEIHRLPIQVEELLYPALEDSKLDLILGEGSTARSVRLDLPPFTLIGATTKIGNISAPLRDRFPIHLHLENYNIQDIKTILLNMAQRSNVSLTEDAAELIAARSRGVPRVAGNLLRRVIDFSKAGEPLTASLADHALGALEIDSLGLSKNDKRYLHVLADFYKGGPAGIETMAAALNEQVKTLEDFVEPYILRIGLIERTRRGRILTHKGWSALDEQKFV